MQPAYDNQHKALEMTMRDVMDNLDDAASYAALNFTSDGFEILSIEAERPELYSANQRAEVVLLATNSSAA